MNQKSTSDIEITKEKLLLVEGKDEKKFFKILLEKNEIYNIQIISSGGKSQFKRKLPAIKNTSGFDEITSLAVIHDADTDAQAAFKSVCSVLKNNDLNFPNKVSSFIPGSPNVGVFIIPDGKNPGMLESLCLSTVQSESITDCIEPFINCVRQKTSVRNTRYKFPRNVNKAKCKAFLSAMEEDIPSLGIAAEKGYWNLDSDRLTSLLDFLKKLDCENGKKL